MTIAGLYALQIHPAVQRWQRLNTVVNRMNVNGSPTVSEREPGMGASLTKVMINIWTKTMSTVNPKSVHIGTVSLIKWRLSVI